MVGSATYDDCLFQDADRIGIDMVVWKAFVEPEKFYVAPVQTVVHRNLREATDERKILNNDLNEKTGISKQLYEQIINSNSRLGPEFVQKLIKLQKLPPKQRAVLCKYTDVNLLKKRRQSLITVAMQR